MAEKRLMLAVQPDWSVIRTAKESEKYFTRFKFEGPGVYFHNRDSMLVVPVDGLTFSKDDNSQGLLQRPIWKQKWPPSTQFIFYIWNDWDVSSTFNALVNAPTRHDERGVPAPHSRNKTVKVLLYGKTVYVSLSKYDRMVSVQAELGGDNIASKLTKPEKDKLQKSAIKALTT